MNTHSLFSRFGVPALALVLALNLTACQSSSGSMDDEGPMMEEGIRAEVTTSGTIEILEQGLANIGTRAAVTNINSWQARLEEADASGFSDTIRDLGRLEEELQSGSIEADAAAQLLNDLGRQTIEASSMANGRAAENVRRLGQTLIAGAESLQ